MSDTPQRIVVELVASCLDDDSEVMMRQAADRIQKLINAAREEGRKEGRAEILCNRTPCAVEAALKQCTQGIQG